MSSAFKPITIPPGVVSTPTKKMMSSNWSEVNLVRWRENMLMPMGGQSQLSNSVTVTATAGAAFDTTAVQISMATNPGQIRPGMDVINTTTGQHVGTVKAYGSSVINLVAQQAITTNSLGIYMPPNPGNVVPGMTVTDTTNSQPIGTVRSYGIYTTYATATASWAIGATTITTTTANPGDILPGMTCYGMNRDGSFGKVLSYVGTTLTLTAPATYDGSPSDHAIQFSNESNQHVLVLTVKALHASTGANDTLQFSGGAPFMLTLMGPAASASSGVANVLQFTGNSYSFASRCRKIHGWYDVNSKYRIAYLCEQHLYVDTDAILVDITPANGMAPVTGLVGGYGDQIYSRNILLAATQPWTTGSSTISMVPSTSSITPGLGVYNTTANQYVGVVQSYNNKTLTLTANAASAGSAGDVLDFDAYGRSRDIPASVSITKIPDAYSLNNFGGVLYAMTSSDQRLLMWDPAVGGPAIVQPADVGPPSRGPVPNGRCFVVTQERFIVIFGSFNDGTSGTGLLGGGRRRFAWCDQENPGAWDYSNVTSQAGFLDVEPGSPIICATASRTGILFWTAKKTYASRFLGLPYVYNYVELCDEATPWSPQSVMTTSALTLWMSEQGVFSYDGTSVLPVVCNVRPWIDKDINQVMVRETSFACHLGEFNEWWWFFPTLNSQFNNRAAVYNYKEGWWTQVRMSRSAGITSSYTSHPIFADDYAAFQHEVYLAAGYSNASMPVVLPFAETFDLNLAAGTRLTTVKQLIPDVEAVEADDPATIANAIENLRYSLFYRRSRSIGDPELQSPGFFRQDGYVDFRVTGRDLRLRIDVGAIIQPFTLGAHLIDSVPRGDR